VASSKFDCGIRLSLMPTATTEEGKKEGERCGEEEYGVLLPEEAEEE